ncbi:2,3-diaminopropionate biosynthesis protein SbnA [Dactylosporangium vinaceum]|uniref:2,3-diaminopropionate biosynthesis protein SbnA n=1 Tax=Dactylosporangium vinaceum TaxID=53362 RepID=A0ABV5M2V7_9ACTN|nr:2,3-diaminopropionate biosynthesis protein SbnA [Dactylosporangium vinaceum]UAB99883.1 2,3-diaminopropionate biosynthesis protein SbnA [Dactylosporangium vinaceum]
MPIISAPHEYNEDNLYVDLAPSFGVPLYLKCEGFNFSGSIKQKAALQMVEGAEKAGRLTVDSILVESSSGNLGVALSMIAASKGYRFVCVTDARCSAASRHIMRAFGAEVHTVTDAAADGGLLGARLAYVRGLCAADERYVWLNQYVNADNWRAHHQSTAPHIAAQFPHLDALFVGAGTTGTLMGCARWFREHRPEVRIVAVDTVGSVIFGGAPRTRLIPGLGAAVRPPLLDEAFVDDVVRVTETDTVQACRRLLGHGFLFGGSTGSVVFGAVQWLTAHADSLAAAVAIAPDLGERYLDSLYQPEWVEANYGLGPAA